MIELPKTVVAAFVFIRKEEKILLVKQGYGRQFWSLPGGVMEKDESIDQAAIREVREETGLGIRLGKLIGVYSKPSERALALTFEGNIVGGELRADSEVIEVCYFPLANLPENIRDHLRQRVEDFTADLPYAVIRTQ
jgi:ADP-ribose pyrophosphatase YjhB (NUDIX family)